MQPNITTWGGDATQQARRAMTIDQMDRPSYWLREAWNDLRTGMRGTANEPSLCFRNCVNSLVKALERGADDIDLCADTQPGANGMPLERDLVAVWRGVSAALENEALLVYKAQHDAHAQIEAVDSMEPIQEA